MKQAYRLMLFGMALLALALPLRAVVHPDFSGTWELNLKLSSLERRGRPGGRDLSVTLMIHQAGDHFRVTRRGAAGGSAEISFKAGDPARKIPTPRGPATIEAKWEGKLLMVRQIQRRRTPRGPLEIRQVQYWSLSKDGHTLTQSIDVTSGLRTFERKLVFERR